VTARLSACQALELGKSLL